jgi:hypothetical protein
VDHDHYDGNCEALIEAQLCQTCGHHIGSAHDGTPAGDSPVLCSNCTDCAEVRSELLTQMTQDAEPYADQADIFGPPREGVGCSPAEEHAIMQRVTGQPKYPTRAEMDAEARERLAGPWPGTMHGELRLTKYNDDGSLGKSMLVPNATVSVDLTPPVAKPGDAEWNRIWTGAGKMTLPDLTPGLVDDELSEYIGRAAVAEAKADEESLRAMGAKGDGADVLFETDSPARFDGRVQRVRVLLRDQRVAVEVLASERVSEVLSEVGRAMFLCAQTIANAVEAARRANDALAGVDDETERDTP